VTNSTQPQQRQPAYPTQGYAVFVQPRPTSASSVVTFVVGLVTLLGGFMLVFPVPLTWAIGHAALKETKDGQKSGRGLAVAGVVLAWIAFVPMLFWTLSLVIRALDA
jgi:hypothetical protein